MIRHDHIYVFVFNLRNPGYEVLDNGGGEDDVEGKYGSVFNPLVSYCVYFANVVIILSNIKSFMIIRKSSF